MLSSRQQQEHESVDEFMHALDLLAKECTFVDMNANEYRNQFICDSFIRGLKSPEIRQRVTLFGFIVMRRIYLYNKTYHKI